MQIFAAATGSPRFGGAALFIFTLAVIPNALSNEVITHTVGESRVAKSSAVSGVLILVLGFFLLSTGVGTPQFTSNLSALFNNSTNEDFSMLSAVAEVKSDMQTVDITIENNRFTPTILYVKKNVPLQINFKYLGNNNDKLFILLSIYNC